MDDIAINLDPVQPVLTKKESKASSNKYISSSPEPLPLFDCHYCAGLHEHLVLQTCKEKQLHKLYGKNFNPR